MTSPAVQARFDLSDILKPSPCPRMLEELRAELDAALEREATAYADGFCAGFTLVDDDDTAHEALVFADDDGEQGDGCHW